MFSEMTVFTINTNRVNCKTSSQRKKMDTSQGIAKAVFLLHHIAVGSLHFVSLSLSLSLSLSHCITIIPDIRIVPPVLSSSWHYTKDDSISRYYVIR